MNRVERFALKAALAALVAAAPGATLAQVACTVAVSPMNFGTYSGATVQVTGTVDLVCSGPSGPRPAFSVTASPGSSNTYAQRTLRRTVAPVEMLNYSLAITLATGSANWGDGSGGTSAWTGRTAPINPGNPERAASTTITATLAAGAVPSAGNYTDTIVVTATWN